ncbi:hypothetical protein NUH88_18255 [Nisaea acidiphila]|uniref:Uncharacterized protein n=1 Tax=Nisaea acidiphila TaxID=1862145 RepID=A0A9J7ARZ1_9PROT|nr:hypothetical protein [Nisaea acidiphila]UUX49329.1 hypothetical protein NUH88_18255 [Nisaea acidiphila]
MTDILQEIRNPPDMNRWNRSLWNYLDADLSALQYSDAVEIASVIERIPAIGKVSYKSAFVAKPGPDQSVLRLYDAIMREKGISGRNFRIFDDIAAAREWLQEPENRPDGGEPSI